MKITKIILFAFLLFILGTSFVSAKTVSDSVTVTVIDVPQSCFDGIKNNGETSIDKGGPCPDELNAAVGTLTGDSCEIELGKSECPTNLSWSITPPIAGVKSQLTKTGFITVVSAGDSTGKKTDNISYGKTIYYLFYGSPDHLAAVEVTASCKVGSWDSVKKICANNGLDRDRWRDGWNEPCSTECGQKPSSEEFECIAPDGCTPNVQIRNCPGTIACTPPTVKIDVAPKSIRIGQSTKVTWTSTKMVSCTSDNGNFSTSGLLNGNVTKSNIQKSTTYAITCKDKDGKAYKDSAQVTVDITDIIEI